MYSRSFPVESLVFKDRDSAAFVLVYLLNPALYFLSAKADFGQMGFARSVALCGCPRPMVFP
jgi:hypothetical protein